MGNFRQLLTAIENRLRFSTIVHLWTCILLTTLFTVYVLLEICMKVVHTKRMFSFEKFQNVFMQNLVPKGVHLLEVKFTIIQTAQYSRVTQYCVS